MSSAQITAPVRPRALGAAEIGELDPYAFFAVLGNVSFTPADGRPRTS